MPGQTITVKATQTIAQETLAVIFEKPAGFSFKPGQFADFTLIDPPETDDEGNTRTFSLASAPYEEDVMIATRLRDSAFKRVLQTLPPGEEMLFDGAYGSFTLHNKQETPAVFVTGGIGITAVRSMILQAAHEQRGQQLVLFDSNKRPETAPFLDELMVLSGANPHYTYVGTMTGLEEGAETNWTGMRGHLTGQLLIGHVPEPAEPIYYVVGPRAFVAGMREILEGAGVDDDNIRTEEFSGY